VTKTIFAGLALLLAAAPLPVQTVVGESPAVIALAASFTLNGYAALTAAARASYLSECGSGQPSSFKPTNWSEISTLTVAFAGQPCLTDACKAEDCVARCIDNQALAETLDGWGELCVARGQMAYA
jgi:hypothetical protein